VRISPLRKTSSVTQRSVLWFATFLVRGLLEKVQTLHEGRNTFSVLSYVDDLRGVLNELLARPTRQCRGIRKWQPQVVKWMFVSAPNLSIGCCGAAPVVSRTTTEL
jgi:hypothetical protein